MVPEGGGHRSKHRAYGVCGRLGNATAIEQGYDDLPRRHRRWCLSEDAQHMTEYLPPLEIRVLPVPALGGDAGDVEAGGEHLQDRFNMLHGLSQASGLFAVIFDLAAISA